MLPALMLPREWTIPVAAPAAPEGALPRAVLVVDDDRAVRESLRFLLESEGCAVSIAAGVHAAARLLHQYPFAVMISDLMMAGGGVRWFGRIRSRYPFMTVIVITAAEVPDSMRTALGASVSTILAKPVPLAELLAAIGDVPIRAARAA